MTMIRIQRVTLFALAVLLCLLSACITQVHVPCLSETVGDDSTICHKPSSAGIPINDDFSIIVSSSSINTAENQSSISITMYAANIGTKDTILLPGQFSVLTSSGAPGSVSPPPRAAYGTGGSFPFGLPIRPEEITYGTMGFILNESVSYPFVLVAYESGERENPTYIRIVE
jgi:hypothetical protein